ncbi:MAG: TetR/AcrR family transcriptional regulator [Microthrixaceae bacterium]
MGVDGRVQRGERTREAIVHALLDLLNEGVVQPTSQQIASMAGVSVRSIFQHFEDMEALYADLSRAQDERTRPWFELLDTGGDLRARTAALADQRRDLFEHIAPVRHAIGSRARTSGALATRLAEVDRRLRSQVEHQFQAELVVRRGADRADLLTALDLLWSFDAWDRVRSTQGLAPDVAARALRRATTQLLGD